MLPVIPLELQGKTHQAFSITQPFGLRRGRKGRGIRINPLNGVVQRREASSWRVAVSLPHHGEDTAFSPVFVGGLHD